ncbi:hypothetical protein EX30DRAFT_231877 [Ascodesmis nigricans]|uniref:Uncharacterized protein n=1 Tax=Ascodesmis nigricans TaxID=341454 RepID=A0A4S2MIE4_9PEZI|nr:hypothetical protein EX30DRAFT_231877 [Ascodesmis nigricans]
MDALREQGAEMMMMITFVYCPSPSEGYRGNGVWREDRSQEWRGSEGVVILEHSRVVGHTPVPGTWNSRVFYASIIQPVYILSLHCRIDLYRSLRNCNRRSGGVPGGSVFPSGSLVYPRPLLSALLPSSHRHPFPPSTILLYQQNETTDIPLSLRVGSTDPTS